MHYPQVLLLAVALVGCSNDGASSASTDNNQTITMGSFGKTEDGREVTLYTLQSSSGIEIQLTDFGATLVSVQIPDRSGTMADVILGFDDVSGYEGDTNQYFGCIAGRVANRVAGATYELDGETVQLVANNGEHSLHGGAVGFGKRLWSGSMLSSSEAKGVAFTYVSPDGEEGHPGELTCRVEYRLYDNGELRVDYSATTTAPTAINLTNHAYWNLAGAGSPTIKDHSLTLYAEQFTASDETLIPTGELQSVEGTALDFRTPHLIGERIASLDDTGALGYDHNFVVDGKAGEMRPAARLEHPESGRVLEILTDQPGIQFYSGNFLEGQSGKGGKAYAHRSALCLETQHYPDSPNQPNFPSVILRPGETYTHAIVHRFSVSK